MVRNSAWTGCCPVCPLGAISCTPSGPAPAAAGDVPVYRAGPDGKPVLDRTLTPGTSATVTAGEWVVGAPDDHHRGANEGSAPLIIYTSSLLRQGAPLAMQVPS